MSPSLFDELVRDERMPKPIRINSRVLWDRVQLDEAFATLSDREEGGKNDPWSAVRV